MAAKKNTLAIKNPPKHLLGIQNLSIQEVMTRNCKSIAPHETALIAMQLMENNSLNSLPVVDSENRIVGAINMHTLIQAKLF
jgi:arabinose-5-phosphate isomerase